MNSQIRPELPPLPAKQASQSILNNDTDLTDCPLPPDLDYFSGDDLDSLLQNTERLKQYVHGLNLKKQDYQEMNEFKVKFESLLYKFEKLYQEKDQLEVLHFQTKSEYEKFKLETAKLKKYIDENLSKDFYRRNIDQHLKTLKRETDAIEEKILEKFNEELFEDYLQKRIKYHTEFQKYESF